MDKLSLYAIGKSDYKLSDFLISQIIKKHLKISDIELFLLSEIQNESPILVDFLDFKNNKPIEYILNSANFYSLDFFVDNRVLIPRNDTEILVKTLLDTSNDIVDFDYIDVGSGSGAIQTAFYINNINKPKNAYSLDLSTKALEVSKINFEKHNILSNINLLHSDLLEVFINQNQKIKSKNLLVSANLPYIKDDDFQNMDIGVYLNEPSMALYGGKETGFELYEKLISQSLELKNFYKLENVILFIEIGFDQYEYSKKYLTGLGAKFEYFKDMNNINRCIKINL